MSAAPMPIEGFADPRFQAVRDAFAVNMSEGHEIGAAVAVILDGRPVVDLWGGYRDGGKTLLWQRDTIVCMMSVTKAMGAIAVLMLADRGELELDDPVAKFWPEFAQHGKEPITIRMILAQQECLPYVDALKEGELWDHDKAAAALAAQAPEWPIGTKPCYHSFTAGLLYQQIVRHVDGRTIGRYFREEISEPFDIDYHIGLTPEEDARRAEFIETPGTASWEGIKGRRPSPLMRAWASLPPSEDANSDQWRFNEFASAAGHGSPRSAAELYAALASGGVKDRKTIIGEALIEEAIQPQWDGIEAMTNRHFRYGTGFMLSCPPFPIGLQPHNFGHGGIGGAVAFGDPVRRLGFAYAGNHMAPYGDAGPYATRLIDALYSIVG